MPADRDPSSPQRLRRADRRAQILRAATGAFARRGFAETGLDDVAAGAGVTRALLYRHFESKTDLYRAVLDRARGQLQDRVGRDHYDGSTIRELLAAAAADPDAFRLLFRHAAREPAFRPYTEELSALAAEVTERHLTAHVDAGPWRDWASQLLPSVTVEAVIAWLDVGRPAPDEAHTRILDVVEGVIGAARRSATGPNPGRPA